MCGKNAIPLLFRNDMVYNAPDSKLKSKMFNPIVGNGNSGNEKRSEGRRGNGVGLVK